MFISRLSRKIRHKFRKKKKSFEERIAPLVEEQAEKIRSELRTDKKAVFVDMGSNLGQGFEFFSKFFSPGLFDYLLIEANPNCIEPLRNNISKFYESHTDTKNWSISNFAISDENGHLDLYGLVEDERGGEKYREFSQGASVVSNHNSRFYESNQESSIKIESKRASDLIKELSSEYQTIVVKMDIESSEYDALEDLIDSGMIEKVSHLYVEWHSKFFSEEQQPAILAREKKIQDILGAKMTKWH